MQRLLSMPLAREQRSSEHAAAAPEGRRSHGLRPCSQAAGRHGGVGLSGGGAGRPQEIYTYADALRWSQQIAEGLAYLHDRSPLIIHRDLKLDNVLLCGADLPPPPLTPARAVLQAVIIGGACWWMKAELHLFKSTGGVGAVPPCRTVGGGQPAAAQMSRPCLVLRGVGDLNKWDAKIADFGLHATVDATNQLDAVKALCAPLHPLSLHTVPPPRHAPAFKGASNNSGHACANGDALLCHIRATATAALRSFSPKPGMVRPCGCRKDKVHSPTEEDQKRLRDQSATQTLDRNMVHMPSSRTGPASIARSATFKNSQASDCKDTRETDDLTLKSDPHFSCF